MTSDQPDRKMAIRVVSQLRAGVPKLEPSTVRFLHVGREKWLEGIKWDLTHAREAGASSFRFVKGDYGDGKSHFLLMTTSMALQERMAVSYVSIENKSQLRAFDFELVWKELIYSMATPESEGDPEGFAGLLGSC